MSATTIIGTDDLAALRLGSARWLHDRCASAVKFPDAADATVSAIRRTLVGYLAASKALGIMPDPFVVDLAEQAIALPTEVES